eukprot:453367-Pelagomonas_calceolata.AAC.5
MPLCMCLGCSMPTTLRSPQYKAHQYLAPQQLNNKCAALHLQASHINPKEPTSAALNEPHTSTRASCY